MSILDKLFARNQSKSFLRSAQPVVEKASELEEEIKKLSQEGLKKRLLEVKKRTKGQVKDKDDVAEVFAIVRESARRTLGERHYDVQLIGGLALTRNRIAEMRTGEGKTLVATLPVVLHSLAGKGVHVVTVNDYLARRDGTWMGQVYYYLGLSLGVVTASGSYIYDPTHTTKEEDSARDETGAFRVFYDFLRPATKQEAYLADITYATNNELGFDYLRDNTAYDRSQIVQRGHYFALVDEIDSILIDEARTPLIISGPAEDSGELYKKFAILAESFVPEKDYTVDEKLKAIQITDDGITKAEKALGIENLYTEGGVKYAHHLETSVRAKALFSKDKEYVVKDGEIVIVDEFTGRLQPGRRWSEGLHQAIEAKEGVEVQKETRTYASVTFQNYFRMYEKLSGMTGTALSSEEEFYTVYALDVVVIPTNRFIKRKDHNDQIFQTALGKYHAVAKQVALYHKKGQPVLVGTVSIEDNEIISRHLTEEGVPHEVLNAKNHEREGEIIAQAGRKGRVTVATNMAGRGVDIKLGGSPADKAEHDEVIALGGLVVIGTERHEARRIDNQLRGRSGRQGDPGETRFYVSLEDKLMRVFASDAIKKVMSTLKIPENEPIESAMITKSLESAQERIEGFNFDSRKQILAYDDVLNTQRLAVYEHRHVALFGTEDEVLKVVSEMAENSTEAQTAFDAKFNEFGKEVFVLLLRRLLLQVIDVFWLEQLEMMEYLRQSVSLRAYGQRDPLIEYRREGIIRFKKMEEDIERTVRESLPRIVLSDTDRMRAEEEKTRQNLVAVSSGDGSEEDAKAEPIVNDNLFGRNDHVTIRKGDETRTLKYKKAEPLLADGWGIVEPE